MQGKCVIDCNDGVPAAGNARCAAVSGGVLTCMPTGVATGFCTYACEPESANCPAGMTCYEPAGTSPTAQNACLPTGGFPGSPCRDPGATGLGDCGIYGLQMNCVGYVLGPPEIPGTCLIPCSGGGGDATCSTITGGLATCANMFGYCMPPCDATGDCVSGQSCFTSEPVGPAVCMPTGSFPGSPCLPIDGFHTNPWCHDIPGATTQVCYGGQCVPTCNDTVVGPNPWSPTGGDLLCGALSPLLTCMPTAPPATPGLCVYHCDTTTGACADGYSCFDPWPVYPPTSGTYHQNACLPDGSFPGSHCPDPREPHGGCGTYLAQMECYADKCLIPCDVGNEAARCAPIGLQCDIAYTGFCMPSCAGGPGTCPTGMFCTDALPTTNHGEQTCLPIGAVPGGPCRPSGVRCDIDIVRNGSMFDMACHTTPIGDLCLVTCANDGECVTFDASLHCNEVIGGCMTRCDTGPMAPDCGFPGSGWACFQNDVCVPAGTFPGSSCTTDAAYPALGSCAPLGPGATPPLQTCIGEGPGVTGRCAPVCTLGNPATGTPLCEAVSQTLFCLNGAFFPGEGLPIGPFNSVCAPKGTIPLGPCAPGDVCTATPASMGSMPLDCDHGICTFGCSGGSGNAFCGSVGTAMGGLPITCDDVYTHSCRLFDPGPGVCNFGVGAGINPVDGTPIEFVATSGDNLCLRYGTIQWSTCRAPGDPHGPCDSAVGGNVLYNLICDPYYGCILACPPNPAAILNICADFGLTCDPYYGCIIP
jgi:hypothetical protein